MPRRASADVEPTLDEELIEIDESDQEPTLDEDRLETPEDRKPVFPRWNEPGMLYDFVCTKKGREPFTAARSRATSTAASCSLTGSTSLPRKTAAARST